MDFLAKNLSLDFSEGVDIEFKNGKATGKFQKKLTDMGRRKFWLKKLKNID